MTPEKYQRFTQELVAGLSGQNAVLGLVAVGSMAGKDYLPDQWSDHDFYVIVEQNHQESFRARLDWLPYSADIIFSFRETAHGLKVLYRNAHLVEVAVFDLNELYLAQVNRYRILLDRCNLEPHLRKICERTKQQTASTDLNWLFGQFLTNLLVGVGRHRRGEHLSAHFFVKYSAVRHLLLLCHALLSSTADHLRDEIDPFRRMEIVFPQAANTLDRAMLMDTPDAAIEMLAFANENLRQHLTEFPATAVQVVSNFLNTAPNQRA